MTREENIAKLAELRSKAEELVKDYNEAYQNKKFDETVKLDEEISKCVNEHTSIARDICFDECKSTADPMLTAVTKLRFSTIAVKDEKQGDDKIPVRVIVEKRRPIDLQKLHNYCGGIGVDKNWSHVVQKLNFLMTARVCLQLGIDPKQIHDSYLMSDIAKDIDMGKTPTSNTALLKQLQMAVNAMIGEEYKATSHDVAYLVEIYSKKGREPLTVICANHRHFREYMAELCHSIVTYKTARSYMAEYKRKPEAK